jgi:hypothetical protein
VKRLSLRYVGFRSVLTKQTRRRWRRKSEL